MSRRKRTPNNRPRCKYCRNVIRWLGKPNGTWATFDPNPVDSRDSTTGAYPVLGRKAWDFNELLAELQVMRGCDVDEARQEVLDLPWYRLHRCGERIAAARNARERETPVTPRPPQPDRSVTP